MSSAPQPAGPAEPAGAPEISESARIAREKLHEEIERVRNGVEEMLDEQERNGNGKGKKASTDRLRRELDELRFETREYVKKKVKKSEKKLERSIRELEARSDRLEDRIDEVEAEREEAEWRIHNDTEQMLDGLLEDVREIADRLVRHPAPAPRLAPPAPRQADASPSPPRPQAPVGRIGPLPAGRGRRKR
jgi:hypothetical protein